MHVCACVCYHKHIKINATAAHERDCIYPSSGLGMNLILEMKEKINEAVSLL